MYLVTLKSWLGLMPLEYYYLFTLKYVCDDASQTADTCGYEFIYSMSGFGGFPAKGNRKQTPLSHRVNSCCIFYIEAPLQIHMQIYTPLKKLGIFLFNVK